MPINVDSPIAIFSQFHELAERIIGIAFRTHNRFGRLLDEAIYKNAIRAECEAAGITPVRQEVEIKVCHEDFAKSYFMDLLCADGLMVEAKTADALTPMHEAQALHYLLLTEMRHGLLINLRPGKVAKRYVSTTLDMNERRRYTIHDSNWIAVNNESQRLRDIYLKLIDDWGAFLHKSLYREALIHFFGGPHAALHKIPIYQGSVVLGTQETFLITKDTAVAMTTLKDGGPS